MAVQIVAGLMFLGAIGMIIIGIPLLIFFGFGVIPIGLGAFFIWCSLGLFKMKKKSYTATLVAYGIFAVLTLMVYLSPSVVQRRYSIWNLAFPILFAGIIYSNREKFVN